MPPGRVRTRDPGAHSVRRTKQSPSQRSRDSGFFRARSSRDLFAATYAGQLCRAQVTSSSKNRPPVSCAKLCAIFAPSFAPCGSGQWSLSGRDETVALAAPGPLGLQQTALTEGLEIASRGPATHGLELTVFFGANASPSTAGLELGAQTQPTLLLALLRVPPGRVPRRLVSRTRGTRTRRSRRAGPVAARHPSWKLWQL
jgi:hypothetical protein